ncbi:MAG: hypothetical protein MZV64_49425 [Ignavibacteriales bacterium]|nr:hypothetical protein [Ignavibacteriales bacterium]
MVSPILLLLSFLHLLQAEADQRKEERPVLRRRPDDLGREEEGDLRQSGHRLLRRRQDLPDVVQAGVDLGLDHLQAVHRLLGLDQGLFGLPGGLAELVQEEGEERDRDDRRRRSGRSTRPGSGSGSWYLYPKPIAPECQLSASRPRVLGLASCRSVPRTSLPAAGKRPHPPAPSGWTFPSRARQSFSPRRRGRSSRRSVGVM